MQSGHQPRTLGLTNRRRPSSSDHGLQALLAAHQPEQISNLPKVALSLRRSPYQGGAACPQDALSLARWRGLSPRRSLPRGHGRQRIRDNACHLVAFRLLPTLLPRWRGLSPRRSLLRGYGRQRIRDNACHLVVFRLLPTLLPRWRGLSQDALSFAAANALGTMRATSVTLMFRIYRLLSTASCLLLQ
jgi:hypothetical protein